MNPITITDGRGNTAAILPEKGATVISLCCGGREYLYCDRENLESPERPRCGIPFLFPIFGRLKDGRYTWEGKEYAMQIHGFGHTSSWRTAERRTDSLTLVLEADENTLEQYPFRFRVTLAFSIAEGTLTIAQKYENLDSKPMPYNYGFHPYFRTETLEALEVETGAKTLFDFAKGPSAFGHGTLKLTMPAGAPETGAALMGVEGPTVLRWTDGGKLTMEFDQSIHTHVLWSMAGKEFLCVEPVNGSADGLNTGNYMTLQPGETAQGFVRFRAE